MKNGKDKATRVPMFVQRNWPLAMVVVIFSGLWLTELWRRNRAG